VLKCIKILKWIVRMSDQFEFLSDFLTNRMSMSHIYQPVMLKHLLESGGQSNVTDIAKAILVHDHTQIEYYEAITKRYPSRVLQARKITERVKNECRIAGFDDLEESEVAALIQICSAKLKEYLQRKKSSPWQHRKKSSGNIPGSVKFEVLKNARHRCQLCGISADQKALEPDHIIPRERGGSDDITNLQALCYSCNSMKRDRDDTDFRNIEEEYSARKDGCPFCVPDDGTVLKQERLAYSILGDEPNPDHILIVPRRHIENYFGLYQPELNTIQRLLNTTQTELKQLEEPVVGFEVTFQASTTKGESQEHAHLNMFVKRNS